MQTTPTIRVTRFAQLEPGDLFILRRQHERYVGLMVRDSAENGQTFLLPIGPSLPRFMTYPSLTVDPGTTVISFGKDYILSLPTDPAAWEDEPPPASVTAIAVTDAGVFLRCNFLPHRDQFRACYVDLTDGEICIRGTGTSAAYAEPLGIRAYATRWELLTTTTPPRSILNYPFNASEGATG